MPRSHPIIARHRSADAFGFPLNLTNPSKARLPTAIDSFLQSAIAEARQGLAEGGIPIGSVLVIDGQIVGRGHDRRVQRGSRDPPRRDGRPRKRGPPQSRRLSPRRPLLDALAVRHVFRHGTFTAFPKSSSAKTAPFVAPKTTSNRAGSSWKSSTMRSASN